MQAYVTKSKDEDKKQEKPDDGSIMGFLGLVRKPSTDEEPKKDSVLVCVTRNLNLLNVVRWDSISVLCLENCFL